MSATQQFQIDSLLHLKEKIILSSLPFFPKGKCLGSPPFNDSPDVMTSFYVPLQYILRDLELSFKCLQMLVANSKYLWKLNYFVP